MRIIRGSHKGRKIIPHKDFNSRPTTDFAKESLFNILDNKFDYSQLNVLDLFAGTGNISFEFLSRGCRNVFSVELNKIYSQHINKQITILFPGKENNVITADVYKYCKQESLLNFDIIFADPPYNDPNIELLFEIFKNKTLENALLIIEHSDSNNFSGHQYFIEKRRYGNVNFSFFKKSE